MKKQSKHLSDMYSKQKPNYISSQSKCIINHICPCKSTYFSQQSNIDASQALINHKFNHHKYSHKLSLRRKSQHLRIIAENSEESHNFNFQKLFQTKYRQSEALQIIDESNKSSSLLNIATNSIRGAYNDVDLQKTDSSERNQLQTSDLKLMLKSDELTDQSKLCSTEINSNTLKSKNFESLKLLSKNQLFEDQELINLQLERKKLCQQTRRHQIQQDKQQQDQKQQNYQIGSKNYKLQSIQQLQSNFIDSQKSFGYSLSQSPQQTQSIGLNIFSSSKSISFPSEYQNIFSQKIIHLKKDNQIQIATQQHINQKLDQLSSNRNIRYVHSNVFSSNVSSKNSIDFARKNDKKRTFNDQIKHLAENIQSRRNVSQNGEPLSQLFCLENFVRNAESVVTSKNNEQKDISEVLSSFRPIMFGNDSTKFLGIDSLHPIKNEKNLQRLITFKKQKLCSQKNCINQLISQNQIEYLKKGQRNSYNQK